MADREHVLRRMGCRGGDAVKEAHARAYPGNDDSLPEMPCRLGKVGAW